MRRPIIPIVCLTIALLLFSMASPATAQGGLALQYWILEPRVIDLEKPSPVHFTAEVSGRVAKAELALFSGETISLRKTTDTRFEATLTPEQALSSYEEGYLHHLLGRIFLYRHASDTTPAWNSFTGISTLPADHNPPMRVLSDDAKVAPHAINIRYDPLYLGGVVPTDVTQRFYELLGDDYDFLAVIEQHDSNHNRFHFSVQDNVAGIGLEPRDRSTKYGSAGRLQGILHFPISDYYDPAENSMGHEIAHQWMEFLHYPNPAADDGAHWPFSDLMYGIMGFDGQGGQGLDFPYRLEPMPNGDYRLVRVSPAQEFNDLELYLMGLAPASEVGPHLLMDNQDPDVQFDAMDAGYLKGPATTLTIEDIIAMNGPRDPPYGEAQTTFRIATIVLSKGRLLSDAELSFFDLVASRGEATEEVPYRTGLAQGMARPFYLMTKQRGQLDMSLRIEPPLTTTPTSTTSPSPTGGILPTLPSLPPTLTAPTLPPGTATMGLIQPAFPALVLLAILGVVALVAGRRPAL